MILIYIDSKAIEDDVTLGQRLWLRVVLCRRETDPMIFKMKWTLAILENLLVGDTLTI